MDEPTNHLDASARRWLGNYVGEYDGTVLVVSHDAEFVRRAAESIAEVAGGRLQLYKSCSFDKFLTERDERQARVVATVEAQERERKRMQGFIDRMGAKASKATQAKDREGKLRKLAVEQEAMKALLIGEQRKPALTLARPPACGMAPLTLRSANIRHPLGSVDIISGAQLEVLKGMRLILRGPNGAGKSTILKALAGKIPVGAGQRLEDDRLELGFFAQDLAQDLPQDMAACEYVADTVRSADSSITDESCRTIMGSLGLIGEKATRLIGSLSGGEKARVALATFCLTPCNVILLDEPTNHLDVDAVAALLEAIGKYEGAVVVVSHDRAFCEAIEATHVGYVADGKISVAERTLRETDFSEEDRGVVNVVVAEEGESSATLPEPSTAAPAPTRPQKPKRDPEAVKLAAEAAKLAAATAKVAVDAAIAEAKAASLDNAGTPPAPPPPKPKPAPPAACSGVHVVRHVTRLFLRLETFWRVKLRLRAMTKCAGRRGVGSTPVVAYARARVGAAGSQQCGHEGGGSHAHAHFEGNIEIWVEPGGVDALVVVARSPVVLGLHGPRRATVVCGLSEF